MLPEGTSYNERLPPPFITLYTVFFDFQFQNKAKYRIDSSPQKQTMAPSLTSPPPLQLSIHSKLHDAKSLKISDGIRTSGQHPPIYSKIQPYHAFPDKISGATVWDAEDYRDNPERLDASNVTIKDRRIEHCSR